MSPHRNLFDEWLAFLIEGPVCWGFQAWTWYAFWPHERFFAWGPA